MLSPTNVAFGSQQVGTTSTVTAVTLTNTGNAPLAITSITIGGSNGSDFGQSNTCPNSLAATSSCTISVTFAPSAAGNRTASVSMSDNAAGSPHSVALSGTGTFPAGTYLSDGFESGLGAWTSIGTGTIGTNSTVVHSGTSAAALTNATGADYSGLYQNLVGGAQAQSYSSFCFRLHGISTPDVLAQGRDGTGRNIWEVDYDSGSKGLDIYFWNGSGSRTDLFSPANAISLDSWNCVEVQATEATAGHGEVWLNGTSIASTNGDYLVANPYSRLFLWNNGAIGTVYFDDVKVTNSHT